MLLLASVVTLFGIGIALIVTAFLLDALDHPSPSP
jgi:hypothetical protein